MMKIMQRCETMGRNWHRLAKSGQIFRQQPLKTHTTNQSRTSIQRASCSATTTNNLFLKIECCLRFWQNQLEKVDEAEMPKILQANSQTNKQAIGWLSRTLERGIRWPSPQKKMRMMDGCQCGWGNETRWYTHPQHRNWAHTKHDWLGTFVCCWQLDGFSNPGFKFGVEIDDVFGHSMKCLKYANFWCHPRKSCVKGRGKLFGTIFPVFLSLAFCARKMRR